MIKPGMPCDEQSDKSPVKRLRRQVNSPYRRRGERGWSAAQRAAQAAAIRLYRPWLKSTGPRSVAGRARCSGNALKHGMRSAPLLELGRALRRQRLDMRSIGFSAICRVQKFASPRSFVNRRALFNAFPSSDVKIPCP